MSKIISIVTSTYRQAQYIREAINSVLAQEGEFYIDYVIIDAASPDETVDILRNYEQEIRSLPQQQEIHGLKFSASKEMGCLGISFRWLSEKDKGTADGVNKGIKMTVGDIFGYLHSDDRYEPGAFGEVVTAFDQYAPVDVVYGKGSYIDERGEYIGSYPAQDIAKDDIHVNCLISQPSGFVDIGAVQRVGGLNERVQNSFDYEYWLRLYHAGYKFQYLPVVLSSTRIHPTTKTNNNKQRIRLENMALVKHYNHSVPFAAKVDAALHFSWLGIMSQKVLWHMTWLQTILARLYAELYFRVSLPKINQVEKEIFDRK